MRWKRLWFAAAALAGLSTAALVLCPTRAVRGAVSPAPNALSFDKKGGYVVPQNYREWVFLSSGIDMVYGPKRAIAMDHSMFDIVFVDPDAYHSFLIHGTWPDKTVMILEIRGAENNMSINHSGRSQGSDLMGVEVHIKDASRFAGGWAFFDVKADGVGTLIPQPADCYTCHREHAAVDTTFTQFYPTLLPIAKGEGTLSAAYLKESSGPEPVH